MFASLSFSLLSVSRSLMEGGSNLWGSFSQDQSAVQDETQQPANLTYSTRKKSPGPARNPSNVWTPPSFSALFQFVSTESREYDDMKSILTAGYIDTSSTGCFAYSNPRLVHSELLEKEVRDLCFLFPYIRFCLDNYKTFMMKSSFSITGFTEQFSFKLSDVSAGQWCPADAEVGKDHQPILDTHL